MKYGMIVIMDKAMEAGDLIAFKPEFVPEGKKRKPILFLGMTVRYSNGVGVEEYHVMDFKGSRGKVTSKTIMKCEVVQKVSECEDD